MRFISPYTKYKLVAVHQEQEVLASGQPRIISPGFIAEWRPHDATTAEREQARRSFHYTGTVTDEGGRMIDPIDEQHRVSTFDTGEIKDLVLRARVEKALLENPAFGLDYVLADVPLKLSAPYALYDKHRATRGQRTIEHAIKDILAAHETAGFDVAHAVAYERENGNSEQVIAALEALATREPDDSLVAA